MPPELVRLPDDLDAVADTEPRKTLDVILDPPVVFKTRPFDILHLKEPTGAQVSASERELGANPTPHSLRRYQIVMIAQVARVPVEVVDAMPISQIGECFRFLATLLGDGPPTGET